MGRICDICGFERPNESFGGRGERAHVCKKCMEIPKAKRKLLLAEETLTSFLSQTHISDNNMVRIRQFASNPNPDISLLAKEMLKVLEDAPTLKRKKGKRSISVTREMSSEIYSRWHSTGLLSIDNNEGEHADPLYHLKARLQMSSDFKR